MFPNIQPKPPTAPLTPHLSLLVLTPANQAQLSQVVGDVDAKDLDKEEIELTALQCRPGEAAKQAVVGEPPQDPTGAWVGPAREPTVEQEGQVEEEQAAHEVHVQPQVDADGLLKPEPAPEGPHRDKERQGLQVSRASCCTTAGPCRGTGIPHISPSLTSPHGAAGMSHLMKMQKAMVKMEKAMATPQPAVATAIKLFAVEPSRTWFCQTCRCWVRQALDQPRKPELQLPEPWG